MITVTNGTVSRTYKVGDYEPRVVSLSFNVDPGSDVESLVAGVVGMVERLARQSPIQGKRRLTGDEIVGDAHPPTPAPAPIEVAPTPAFVSAPEPAPVVPVIPTADDVVKAAQAAAKRLGVYSGSPERRHEVTAVVNKFVPEPNMPTRSTPEAKRADLIAALAELGKSSEY